MSTPPSSTFAVPVFSAQCVSQRSVGAARQMEAILLPLLPLQTALASMYVVIMPHLLLAAMALTVVGNCFLHATRGPRLVGVHFADTSWGWPLGARGSWRVSSCGPSGAMAPPRARGCARRTKRRAWRATARHRLPDCRVNAHTAHLPSGRTRRLRPAGVVTAHRAPQGARVAFRDIGSLARR
jgi:hypothetical protein